MSVPAGRSWVEPATGEPDPVIEAYKIVYARTPENIARLAAALAPHRPYLRGAPPGLPFRIALWDLKGKALGQPVLRLLGGTFHKKIRAYASDLWGRHGNEAAERARRWAAQGYTADNLRVR